MEIFERTTADDFETLRELDLLEQVDPMAGAHRPERLDPARDAELRALVDAIRPENKWPFHTGRTAAGMVATLGVAADRLEPALAERVRPRWTLPDELLRGHDAAGEVELEEPGSDQGSDQGSE
jgi:hypothetical protein